MHTGLKQHHVETDCDRAASPIDRLKAWRFLCAVNKRRMANDPTIGVRIDRPKTDGHPPWTAADVAAFRARWPISTAPRRAMELLFWTGVRIGDACVIGPGHIRDGVLSFRQGKTGDDAHVPWTGPLADHAAHLQADRDLMHQALTHVPRQMTFLATTQGRPKSSKSLGQMIRTAAREAGVEKSAHGLRKARAVALAEGGATTHQIAAWTGHQSLKEVERYTRAASRRRANMGPEQERNTSTQAAPSRTHARK
ncbi:tyrosine-type recombinase/integrase [Jannaschia faecimaris]